MERDREAVLSAQRGPFPAAFAAGDEHGRTCLMTLVHHQEIKIEMELEKGTVDVVYGDVDAARWLEIKKLVQCAKDVVVAAKLLQPMEILSRCALIKINGSWNPAAKILSTVPMVEDQLRVITSLCNHSLAMLTKHQRERESCLDLHEFEPKTAEVIRDAVERAIDGARGCSFEKPVQIEMPGRASAALRGRVGGSRDKTSNHPIPIDVVGTLHGFNFHEKKRVLLVDVMGDGLREINFCVEQIGQDAENSTAMQLDLMKIAQILMKSQGMKHRMKPRRIRVHETRSSRGAPEWTFVRFLD